MLRSRFPLLFAPLLLLLAAAAPAEQSCVGDTNGNAKVTVAELVQAVRGALLGCPAAPAACNGDANWDGRVVVAELVLAVRAALFGCADGAALVADVAWLAAHRGDQNVQIVDARVGAYTGGHIPGALPLSPYTLATTREGAAFQIVTAEQGAAALAATGLRRDATVIVYGAAPEFDPARVVWALRYLGHDDVRYLDGGWDAWREAGQPIAAGNPSAAASSDYTVDSVRDEIRVTGAWVLEQLGEAPYDDSAIQLVDARSAAEFDAGRIPTAVHAPWPINLADDLLRPRYADLGLDPARTTVVYCLAGWRAALAWVALTWLGFADVRVYDGSWLEWGAGGFPVEAP